MAVFAYVRVSTDRQCDSVETQERIVRGYLMMHGLGEPVFYRDEGVSGARPLAKRKAGACLLNAIQPGDIVVAAKLDRMFRSAVDALDMLELFRKSNVSLHLIDLGGDVAGDGIGKLVFTICAAMAEAERDRISERIRDAKQDSRQRGRYLGGKLPFGWRTDENGILTPVPAEQQARAQIIERRASGWSLRQISAALADAGMSLSHVGVRRVLDQEAARIAAE